MRIIISVCTIFLCLTLLPTNIRAQENCALALIQDKGSLDLREGTSLALAQLLKRASANREHWEGAITVPIKGYLVGANAKDLKEASDSYFANTNLKYSDERLISVATQTLSAKAVEAYETCIHASQSGPVITAHDGTPTEVTISVRWGGLPGAIADGTVDVIHGTVIGHFPERWLAGEDHTVVVERDPRREVRVIANIGHQSDNKLIAYLPPALPTRPTRRAALLIGSCLGRAGLEGVRFWGPPTEYCNGLREWGYFDAQVQEVQVLGSCIGHGGPDGLTLWGPRDKLCASEKGWGNYLGSVDVTKTGISYCTGDGVEAGMLLWGPTGRTCAGISDWGAYNQGTVLPK
jgi:hypothetical protein